MSFDALLTHDLTIRRVGHDASVLDERGQPTPVAPVDTVVKGLVQPRSAREMLDFRSAGSQLSDHVVFLSIDTDIRSDDAILYGSARLQTTGIRRLEYGSVPHIEVDARLVTAVPVIEAGS